jgi:parallel beta-helix repeat protein
MTLSIYEINRAIVALCIIGFVLTSLAQADDLVPEYSGAYAEDLVWKSTVTMSGDVLILKGGSLTIQPGTQINVLAAEGTKIDPEYLSSQTELLVRGKLEILGTEDAPVRFVVIERNDLEEIAWSGITLDGAAQSRILHAELERADIAIRIVTSSPEIKGNKISRCRYGIVMQQQSHPKILDNLLFDGEGGIFCWKGSNPYLSGNTIRDHDEEAIFVDKNSRPKLDRNFVSGNAIGLALYPRNLSLDSVSVTDNIENIRFLGRQGEGVVE